MPPVPIREAVWCPAIAAPLRRGAHADVLLWGSQVLKVFRRRADFAREVAVHEAVGTRPHLLPLIGTGCPLTCRFPYRPDGDLMDRLMRGLPPRPGLAADLIEALAALHAAGFVHLDVKPENVLLSSPGGGHELTDLAGCARAGEPLPSLFGSPTYAAPFDGAALPQADLWSLGVTLAVAHSGEMPRSDAVRSLGERAWRRRDLWDSETADLVARCLRGADRCAAELRQALL